MSYENFAYYYDSLMDEQFYEDYYQFIMEHCQFDEVFELGCGTGEMAIRLAKKKKTVYASDISSDMLEVAKQKAIEQKELLLKNVETTDNLKIHSLKHFNNCLVSFSNVSIFKSSFSCQLTYKRRQVVKT